MSVPLAFIGTILIWSTTPLAIKWSSEGPGFIFAVSLRMVIGTLGCLLVLMLVRGKLHWHRQALLSYVAAGLGIFGAMSCVYWGAQFIPSGLVSVIFGLTPLITGVLASIWLKEQALGPIKLLGLACAFFGLVLIFGEGVGTSLEVMLGMSAVLMATLLHSTSTVWVKKLGADLPAITITTGGLLVALPLYLLSWAVQDGSWPSLIPAKAMWSIVYLGLFGSVMGFILFYYVLRHVEASRVGLIPLVSPVLALILGLVLNRESIPSVVWAGSGLILLGMSVYQWGALLWRRGLATQEE